MRPSFLLALSTLLLSLSFVSPGLDAQPAAQPPPAPGSRPYWQQEVHYDINVALHDNDHSLEAEETLEYINHSPDTLSFIYFHCWPNAYKDTTTALFHQLSVIEERRGKVNKNTIRENGWLDHLAFTVNGAPTTWQVDPQYADIIKLLLPEKLLPGGKITIHTPFFVRIPTYFSRLGHVGSSYMITQWYPKPAVYDHKGWHPMPYLDQGEFYSEFGSFKVHITLPASYIVAATGSLQNREELERYKAYGHSGQRTRQPLPASPQKTSPKSLKTLDYFAENVHDFAWFADKALTVDYDTCKLPSGRIIDIFSYYRPSLGKPWRHSTEFIKDAILRYSSWIGEYAYPVASAVEGPGNTSSGGMEYPMITLITSPKSGWEELDGIIAHEIGHNWFYGMLGSNERDHPWMDEGINTFYEFRYEAEKYRYNTFFGSMMPESWKKMDPDVFQDAVYNVLRQMKTTEPIETPAAGFPSESDYAMVVYAKTATWLYLLEKELGRENFEKGMKQYFRNWKFKHPYPADMQSSLEEGTHSQLGQAFRMLYRPGPL